MCGGEHECAHARLSHRQVSDAIPIPGLLETLGPTARAAQEQPLQLPALPSPSSVLQVAAGLLPVSALGLSQRQVADAALLLEQLGSVVKEVRPWLSNTHAY